MDLVVQEILRDDNEKVDDQQQLEFYFCLLLWLSLSTPGPSGFFF